MNINNERMHLRGDTALSGELKGRDISAGSHACRLWCSITVSKQS